MEQLGVEISSQLVFKIVATTVVLVILWIAKRIADSFVKERLEELARFHHWRRVIGYVHMTIAAIILGIIWIKGVKDVATFIGIISAGIAVSMHDTIANLAGWIFIITRKPFRVGDRIQIGDITGDVIDTRPFQFSVIEVKNWVDAEQSTGRIIHVPNSMALRHPLANYKMGFEYIWHEIPVLISFERDWRRAKKILGEIAETAAHLSDGAEEQIRRAAMLYLICFTKLTSILYTTVKESGVMLTIRYIVKPRNRRGSEEMVWEAILTAFEENEDVSLAYPTTRFYQAGDKPGGDARGE
jgi:small-conductance mechanosensitive channel